LHQSDCAFSYFRGKLVRFVHGSILSRIRASSKPGAIHQHLDACDVVPSLGDHFVKLLVEYVFHTNSRSKVSVQPPHIEPARAM
jgi:hypothetical protein